MFSTPANADLRKTTRSWNSGKILCCIQR